MLFLGEPPLLLNPFPPYLASHLLFYATNLYCYYPYFEKPDPITNCGSFFVVCLTYFVAICSVFDCFDCERVSSSFPSKLLFGENQLCWHCFGVSISFFNWYRLTWVCGRSHSLSVSSIDCIVVNFYY